MTIQGTVLGGRYRLLDILGDGGMARVYRAEDERLSRIVAVKTLHQQYLSQPEFVRRFEQEAQLAAGLTHPNIVSIYDVDRDGETYFFVMEYVEGGSLKRLIAREAPLALDRVIAITRQLGAALDTAHAHGVIHRDIKPENILLTATEQVKVSDYGIARALTSPGQTATGMVLGSVSYFSPEQAQGKPATAESDLYSSGIVLYEMLTGHLPFAADNPLATAMQHITQQPALPRSYVPALPPAVEGVVLKALNKNPSGRFHSGAALSDALVAAAAVPVGRAPQDRPAGQPRPAPRGVPAHTVRVPRVGGPPPPRRRAPVLPLLLLLLLGGGVVYAATHGRDIGGFFAGGAAATTTPTPAAGAATTTPVGVVAGAPSASATTTAAGGATTTVPSATDTATTAPSASPTPESATVTAPPSPTPPKNTATATGGTVGAGAAAATIVTAKNYALGSYNTPYAIGPTDTFGAATKDIYAIVWMRNLPSHPKISVRWTYPDAAHLPPYVYTLKDAFPIFWVEVNAAGPGHYSITALVNGKPVGSHSFAVKKGGVTPHSKSGAPATPAVSVATLRTRTLGLYRHKGRGHRKHGGQGDGGNQGD